MSKIFFDPCRPILTMLIRVAIFFLCLYANVVQSSHAAQGNKVDCRIQIVDKDILTMCLHKGDPFQHDHYSLSLNHQLIFHLVDDYVERIELEHIVPTGPSLEFSLSRRASSQRVKILGGCVPVSKNNLEIARKCDFTWGPFQAVRNVWFDFSDKEAQDHRQCQLGFDAVLVNQHVEGRQKLDNCIAAMSENDQVRRNALVYRAWANYSLADYVQALKDQEAAFLISPPQSYAELMNMAVYQKANKSFQAALEFLYQAELWDNLNNGISMMTQYHIGWNLVLLGRFDAAIKVLSAAVPAQPDYPYVFFQRGLAYEGLGNRDMAKSDFERGRELMEKWPATDLSDPQTKEVLRKMAEDGVTLPSGRK